MTKEERAAYNKAYREKKKAEKDAAKAGLAVTEPVAVPAPVAVAVPAAKAPKEKKAKA